MNHVTPFPAPVAYNAATEADRRAAALADIKQMHDDLTESQAMVLQLKADLHREEDRCVMVIEDRNRLRSENAVLRRLLVELATQQSNIALLTVKAQEVVKTIDALDHEPPEPEAA